MRILAFTTVYPSEAEPQKGPYIRTRLQHLAKLADVKLVVPLPLVDYGNPNGKWFAHWRSLPQPGADGGLSVTYCRWFYPPRGGFLNALFLFARMLPLVLRMARQFPFDVISASFAHPEGVCAAMLSAVTGKPFLVTLRGNELLNSRYAMRRAMMAWMFKRASLVVALSGELRDLAVSLGANPEQAVVMPNGIAPAIFHPRDRAACRKKHGIPEDAAVIVTAGQLRELKGHHIVAACAAGLRKSGIPALHIICGGASRADRFSGRLMELVADGQAAGYVRIAGDVPQEELAELMCAADVFCLASTREGWPNVVNEALACGTPVVSARVGAIERLLPGSQYGIIVPVGDSAAMEAALATALKHQWDRAAIARFGGARSWSNVAGELHQLLTTVTGAHDGATASLHHR